MDFIDMIQVESTEIIQKVIESKGIPTDSTWIDYESLNAALQSKRKDVAMLLLAKNCRVNRKTTQSLKTDTPLHHAVALGDLDIIVCLLNKKASIVAVNSKGNTPLHLAFMFEREAIIDVFLASINSTSSFVNSKNNQGLTHLHIACTRNDKSIIEKFLKAGADVEDAVSGKSLLWAGFNALHFAANSKSLEAVRTLVTKSCIDLSIRNRNGQTPFRLAYQQLEDMLVMLDFLSKDFSDDYATREYSQFSYFHMACLRNNPDDMKNFIKKGADVMTPLSCNSYPFAYYTPLKFAIRSAWDDNVEILLKNGADVSLLDDDGMTPLHLAFYSKYLDRQEEIIDQMYSEFDQTITYADKNGLDLLHIACTRNDTGTVARILDSGKKVNKIVSYKKRDFYRFTPLHFAVKYKHVEMAELLIERGANVNANDEWAHGTPLHLAFAAGHKNLIELLLKSGADSKAIQIRDNRTMLHYLVLNDDESEELLHYVERLVIELNLDVNAKDKTGETPLHYAFRNFETSRKWIKLLLDFGADINLETKYKKILLKMNWNGFSTDEAFDYMMLYHHIQKLKTLGFIIHSDNNSFCEKLMNKRQESDLNAECLKSETLAKMEQQRQYEIEQMNSVKLTRGVSLHEFLLLDSEALSAFAKNKMLKKIITDKDLEDYPSYAYLIRLQYRKATNSENVLKKETRFNNAFKTV